MQIRKLFLLGLVLSLIMSCEKNDDSDLLDDPSQIQNLGYPSLEIGNYWVYRHFDITTDGGETQKPYIDSVVINRDTLIRGHQYYILEGTNYPYNGGEWGIIDILRDSTGYIVNHEGFIRFSENNFTDILASKVEVHNQDTLYILTYQMEIVNDPYSVPAGEYEVLNYKGTVITPDNNNGVKNPRYINTLYAKGVGKVLDTYFFLSSPTITEKRLIRYHTENSE